MNRFLRYVRILSMGAMLGLAVSAVQAQTTTLYSDAFNRGTTEAPENLDSSLPDVSYTGLPWTAYVDGIIPANSITTNGTNAHATVDQTNAFLPFFADTGYIYSLSAYLSSPDTSPNDTRSALGFVTNASTTGDFPFIGANNHHATWFQRGPRTGTDQAHFEQYHLENLDSSAPPPDFTKYSIVLDTTGTVWSYTFSRNDVVLGIFTGAPVAYNYIGFGTYGNSMDVKDFLLTQTTVTNLGYTWNGADSAGPAFTSNLNWVGGAAPIDGGLSRSHLVFSGTHDNGVALNNDFVNLVVADDALAGNSAIYFDSAAPAYTISGNTLTVMGSIVNESDNDQTIGTPLSGAAVNIHGLSTKSTILTGGASVSSFHIGGLDYTTGNAVFTGGSVGNPMLYNPTAGPVRVGGDSSNSLNATGTLTMKEYSLVTTSVDDVTIGFGTGGTGTLIMQDNAQVHTTNGMATFVGVNGGNGTLKMSGSSIANLSSFYVGVWNAASVGHVELHDSASITASDRWVEIGQNGNGAVSMDGGSLTVNNGNWIRFGADGGTGNLTMAKTGTIAPTVVASGFALVGHNGNGTIDMSAGSFTCNSMMEVADGNATSSLTMTGDSTLTTHKFNVGNHPGSNGTVDISGGAVFNNTIPDGNGFVDEIQIGISGTGVMKVHGGTALVHPVVTNSGSMRVGHADNAPGGTATLELSGYAQFIQQGADMWAVSVGTTGATGTMTVADHATYTHDGGNFWLSWDRGQGGTTKGILNLQGGVFESRNILTNGGTGTINWQGGVYRMATGGDLNPFQTIFDGGTQIHNIGLGANGFGAIIDTTNQEVNTNVALMHDPLVTTGLDGGLTKIGPNTLTLTGALAYTGNTNVNQGTLVVNNLSTPDATVFVATGATLNATSIVADTLTIGGAPVVIGAAATVPEPSTLALLVLAGLAFVGACLRRK